MRLWVVLILSWFTACCSEEGDNTAGEDEKIVNVRAGEDYTYGDSAGDSDGDADEDAVGDEEDVGDAETDRDTGVAMICPDGRVLFTTSGGTGYCCGGAFPVFCDENTDGFAGGCWSPGVDCHTIVYCDDRWAACPEGTLSDCPADGGVLCNPNPEP